MLRRDEMDTLWNWIGFSEESARNTARRQQLAREGGFCSYHFSRLREMCTEYGIASLCVQIIDQFLETLKEKKSFYLHSDCISEETAPLFWEVRCPLCQEWKAKEAEYFRELISLLDRGFVSEYEKSRGLCIRHFLQIREYAQDTTIADMLYETQVAQLEKMKEDAVHFLRTREPPSRWEQTEDERKSPIRTLGKVAGGIGFR